MPTRRKRLLHHELVAKQYSSHRCCRLLNVSQSHVNAFEIPGNEALVVQIRQLAFKHKRYGYRRIWALLRREGQLVNLKRVRRIWKQEGLKVKKKQTRKRKRGITTLIPLKA